MVDAGCPRLDGEPHAGAGAELIRVHTPAEALRAATAGSAKALHRDDIGRIRVGGPADLTVLDAPSYLHLSYRPGVPIARALNLNETT